MSRTTTKEDLLFKADVLSESISATIDVGRIRDKETYEQYLKTHGFEVTKEKQNIWTVKATESF